MSNRIEVGLGTIIKIHAKVRETDHEYDLYYMVDAINRPAELRPGDFSFREPTGYVGLVEAVDEESGHPSHSGLFPEKDQFSPNGTVFLPAHGDNGTIESIKEVISPADVPQGLIFMASK